MRVRAERIVRGLLRLVLRTFFRRIEVVGERQVPEDRGGLYLSWHPNALIDPSLILLSSPRPVAFGARHGLFRWPLLGRLMRAVGTVPIYRAVDVAGRSAGERREANRRSLDALAGRVAEGVFSGLFPEGLSHDESRPVELKSGAARLYYRARQLTGPGRPAPAIVPVGLHYEEKRVFRSRAVVWYHPPIAVPEALDVTPDPDEPEDVGRERARELTRVIGLALDDAVHATDDWETRHLLNRCRKLYRSEHASRSGLDPGRPRAVERAASFALMRSAHNTLRSADPDGVAEVLERVGRYDRDLRALGLEDHHLDRSPRLLSPRVGLWLALQALLVFLVWPPLILLGVLANAPTAGLVSMLARIGARQGKDLASLKVMIGAVLYPLTWGGVGWVVARLSPRLVLGSTGITAVLVAGLVALGGYGALHYVRAAREIGRAVRVRLTRRRRRRTVDALRHERSELYDAMQPLAQRLGLEDAAEAVRELSGPPSRR